MRKVLFAAAIILWISGSALISKAESGVIQAENTTFTTRVETGQLTGIRIPAVQISLALKEGGRLDEKWLVSDIKGLYYRENDVLIIYGHNTRAVLGNLDKLNTSDAIYLADENGRETLYTATEIKTVTRVEYTKMDLSGKDGVIVTCDGWRDENRLVVVLKKNI